MGDAEGLQVIQAGQVTRLRLGPGFGQAQELPLVCDAVVRPDGQVTHMRLVNDGVAHRRKRCHPLAVPVVWGCLLRIDNYGACSICSHCPRVRVNCFVDCSVFKREPVAVLQALLVTIEGEFPGSALTPLHRSRSSIVGVVYEFYRLCRWCPNPKRGLIRAVDRTELAVVKILLVKLFRVQRRALVLRRRWHVVLGVINRGITLN